MVVERGVARATEPAYADKRSYDGGAPSASERAEGTMPSASVRRDGTGNPERPYFPLFTGVNLIFLINSTICPSRTIPDTAVIA
jgi:hypothetical protein